ncbi:DNA polymerase I [Candidatus Saccharibacteria bacterium]|nr:DNA polymerase I [Candidatus Saccharibacteria bacterium]
MKRLAVIDGKSVFYRGYYAMPNLATKDGTPTGGVYGFVTLAIELIKKLEPDYVAVAWDKKDTNIRKRREIYPEYKAGRKKAPDDFYEQIPILHELLDAFGWPLYEIDDYEADDIMATFAKEAEGKGIETCLITSDLDALQSISPLTKVFAMKNGLGNIQEFSPESFEEQYGLKTSQFLDLKSLMGDSSDNLPGVPGVGRKTAVALLQKYHDLDGVYAHVEEINGATGKKLVAGRDSAYMTKEVARLWTDVPVALDWQVADVNDCDFAAVADILRRLEFHSLVHKLPANMQASNVPQAALVDLELPSVRDLPKDIVFDAEICLYIDSHHPDTLYIASTLDVVYRANIADIPEVVWRALEHATIIAEDVKRLYHTLDRAGVKVHFSEVWDVRQAAFLRDPLARDRSLSALSGDFSDDASPERQMARLMHVYRAQKDSFTKDAALERIAKEFDFPVIWPLFQMERRGMLLDVTVLRQMSGELQGELREIEQEMYTMVGFEFNPASPVQLSEVLFRKLQLPTVGIKRGKTKFSTGQKELDKLRGQHPIIELIERHRELAKLMSTYVEALPKLVDANNRLHTTFNQDVASTGRLSSTNPNLQNIPVRTELGRRIREAFIPSRGKVFVSADYSQFELRLAAVLAGDQSMVDDFNTGVDIHAKTASDVYGVPLEQVSKAQRRDAKVINFGVLYGMSPHGLGAATGMTFGAAKRFIDQYFALRAPIRRFIDKTLEQARTEGYVETYFGRRRPTPDIHSSNFAVRQGAERAAANMPIQGTEADLMKRAMLQVEAELGDKAEQLLQIHDSIMVECAPADAESVAQQMKHIMEAIAPELDIALQVDVSVGENWGEL